MVPSTTAHDIELRRRRTAVTAGGTRARTSAATTVAAAAGTYLPTGECLAGLPPFFDYRANGRRRPAITAAIDIARHRPRVWRRGA